MSKFIISTSSFNTRFTHRKTLHLIERFLSLDDSSFQFVLLIQSRAETLYYHNTVEIFIRSFLCLRLAS